MGDYLATVEWRREPAGGGYSRAHLWRFDGGAEVPASASPQVLKPPLSDPAAVDPEEALVAATSSCHMLFFLSLAERDGFPVLSYRDEAVGTMEKDAAGRISITRIALRPEIAFEGPAPDAAQLDALHHESHARCYIANSIRAEVTVERPD